jgi:hypothetical protein
MRSSLIKSCLLALTAASTVVAQTAGFDVFTQPSTPGSSIAAGSTYTIKWVPSSPAGPISIILLQGASNTTLQPGPTIAKSIESTTGSYAWNIPSTLQAFQVFGFKLSLDSDPTTFQYSTYFSITGLALSSGADSTTVAGTTVTRKVSQVGSITSASTTTISASHVAVNSTSHTSPVSTSTHILPSSTITTATSKNGATTTTSTTSPSAVSSSGAVGTVAVGGTGLLGALFVALGMLL